eukprot:TRINITY_DN6041_c0_g2_i1.p1 TRINITY_DN6041_c0_g2~~TRINITY_DN6041_c0_g2_i1.p1  ORF type:complete len:896 (+),score=257.47 TRINITY_DN6041_c0_g2_i1:75-2762(+)
MDASVRPLPLTWVSMHPAASLHRTRSPAALQHASSPQRSERAAATLAGPSRSTSLLGSKAAAVGGGPIAALLAAACFLGGSRSSRRKRRARLATSLRVAVCSHRGSGRRSQRTTRRAIEDDVEEGEGEFQGEFVPGVRPEDQGLAQALKERTLESLDFDYIVEQMQQHCCTKAAQEMCEEPELLLAPTPDEARLLYDEVLELASLDDADLSLNASMDIKEFIDECTRGTILDPPSLVRVSEAITALLKLRNGLDDAEARGIQLPALQRHVQKISLPDALLDMMVDAFGEDGELSEAKFPELAEKRRRIKELESECTNVMREVLQSGRYNKYLADDGYMQIDGSYVLTVRPQHRKAVGVVKDESRTGKSVYVEPHELSGLSAELKELSQEVKFLVRRIMGQMCVQVSRAADDLRTCLEAAGCIDLARARLFLGEDMEGDVPTVGEEGVILARYARNPTLCLRGGINVVGYRLEFNGLTQGLILSGPNAGGKTVVLKTLGLLALLARTGIPVPAGEDARVDFFDVVLADVGDMQTVTGDLSTYSAHLVAARLMLGTASAAGERGLYLVDEAGTGTDPAQGAALARALLEELLDAGARVVSTTHCMQLKNWAVGDPRTIIAAMEYRNGRPTFRLTENAIGESHAIETARRLDLPLNVVNRAENLLSEDQRSLLQLQRKAEQLEKDLQQKLARAEEREEKAVEAEQKAREATVLAQAREEELDAMQVDLASRKEQMRSQLYNEHEKRINEHEEKLQGLISTLKKGVAQGDTRLKIIGDAIDDLQVEKINVGEKKKASKNAASKLPGALGDSDVLHNGDWVMVLARSAWHGFRGQVMRVMGTDKHAKVSVRLDGSRNTIEVLKYELGKCAAPAQAAKIAKRAREIKEANKPKRDYKKISF